MKKIDEPEFIVSSEELKRNQQRVYEREAQQEQEKKENLIEKMMLAVGIIMIVVLTMILNVEYKKGVEKCVDGGNDRTFCEVNLR